MRCVILVPILLSVAGCATPMPTYNEVSNSTAKLSMEPRFKEWIDGELAVFWERNIESIVTPCSQLIPEATSASARLVVDARSAHGLIRINDESRTPFSTCVTERLQSLAWPDAPEGLRYLPVTINAHTPSQGPKSADDSIISITPSNKSLNRMRER